MSELYPSSSSSSSPSLSSSLSAQGFHLTLSTTIFIPSWPEYSDCSLHVLYTLDPRVYADPYELVQRPGYTTLLWGTSDLERPVSAVSQEPTMLLLSVDPLQSTAGPTVNTTLEVPLHARYGRPALTSLDDAYHTFKLHRPVGFFSCPRDTDPPVPDILLPFTPLQGWPSLPATLISDTTLGDKLRLTVPVGVYEDLNWVDVGTAVVMIAMFFYLLHASIRTSQRLAIKPLTKTN